MLDNFWRRAEQKISINVCMMGPRAVGKTTILTAIFNETQESIAGTELVLKALGDTSEMLLSRKRELGSVFREKTEISDEVRPNAGLDATSAIHEFNFEFGVKAKESRISLNITDFPGEYVMNDPNTVKSFIAESKVIMIAVDTPHLMEENGRFNEAKNKTSVITKFFTETLNNITSQKLVLIIPLKCEKYFHENRMDEVKTKVNETYKDLIDFFKKNKNVACAITPILTLGGVEFDEFYKENGKIVLTNEGIPQKAMYKYLSKDAEYSPAFCVQPLYYLLSFVANQYTISKKDRSFFDRLLSAIYSLFDNDKKLYEEILKMERYRKCDDLAGYQMICGKEMFNYNRNI